VKALTGLALSVSGSIRVPNLTTTALSIKISGSGMITANGTANDQYLEISGSGRYLTDGLTSETMKARICGSGTASVAAMDVLDARSDSRRSAAGWVPRPDAAEALERDLGDIPRTGDRASPGR
jgi:hypothetical protein